MLGKKVGIDLGTSMVRIVVKGEGMIASEPAAVAIRQGNLQATAFGTAGLDAAADDLALDLVHPIVDGAVVHALAVRALVAHALVRAAGRQRIFKPDVVIAVMAALDGGQRRLLLEAATHAGARTVYLIDAAIASALGAGIRIGGPNGHLVVDAGAGKTEVASLAMEGTVSGRCLAGHGSRRLSAAVRAHVGVAHGVEIDGPASEDVVASLARLGPHEERTLEVVGHTGREERRVVLTSTELTRVLEAHARVVIDAIEQVVADTPPLLVSDIRAEGLVLTGGASRLEGLDRHLAAATGLPVHRDAEPHLCAVKGTAHALDNLDVLKRTLMYIR